MENVVGKLLYIYRKIREPSTHAAITGLLAIVGQKIPDETWNAAITGSAVIFGILGVFFDEAKPETKVDGF